MFKTKPKRSIWKITNNVIAIHSKAVLLKLWKRIKQLLLLMFSEVHTVKNLWISELLVYLLRTLVKKILTALERICVHRVIGCQRQKYPIHQKHTALTCVNEPAKNNFVLKCANRVAPLSGVEIAQRICWPRVAQTTTWSINLHNSPRSTLPHVRVWVKFVTSPSLQQ